MKRCTRNKIAYEWLTPCIALCCGLLLAACGGVNGDNSNMPQESISANEEQAEESTQETALAENPEDEAAEPAKTSFTLEEFLELEKIANLTPGEQETALRIYDILESGDMTLVDLLIADMDENGQDDMVVTLRDADEGDSYGYGCIYVYINEEEPYRFYNENWPYRFGVHVQWGDLTGDGRMELVLDTVGIGNGAAGDNYVAVISDTGEGLKELDFPPIPEEMETEFSVGVLMDVYMETEADTYSVYCPYLDESITLHTPNADPERQALILEPLLAGGNVRGFYLPEFVEYEGQNALRVEEYLNGEGGVVHCIGIASFIIVWDEDGTSRIADWWVEPSGY
ncbi:MAG: hypothetical protein J1E83_06700 [Lachnospiraceae bacterium]|nr:hypothetical protein [Lachnospiraceae bacterium]